VCATVTSRYQLRPVTQPSLPLPAVTRYDWQPLLLHACTATRWRRRLLPPHTAVTWLALPVMMTHAGHDDIRIQAWIGCALPNAGAVVLWCRGSKSSAHIRCVGGLHAMRTECAFAHACSSMTCHQECCAASRWAEHQVLKQALKVPAKRACARRRGNITLHYITCSTQPGVVNPIQEPTTGSPGGETSKMNTGTQQHAAFKGCYSAVRMCCWKAQPGSLAKICMHAQLHHLHPDRQVM
jgi:hypothetical protein